MSSKPKSPEMTDQSEDHVGLKVLREISTNTEEPSVDIIAVHGLNSNHQITWCKEEEDGASSCWLTSDLPEFVSIKHGRIMTYGYQSDLCTQNILDEANFEIAAVRFLEEIRAKRKKESVGPIVFLCHSIGGLLVEKALWMANHDKKFIQIAHSARLVVRIAMPDHRI
ncbi:hypothetical protein BKA65DRAFT_167593 [Rhexocercosporidium sp. MPI-PUGE-AT-0058]|nr:hypothetical protein BKA65DRAFT_167593 [Rhexocercosporidium sp. MPI-PUGE-AT-0058]